MKFADRILFEPRDDMEGWNIVLEHQCDSWEIGDAKAATDLAAALQAASCHVPKVRPRDLPPGCRWAAVSLAEVLEGKGP